MSGYDYIVIGAGPAGCVIAARLTEDPEVQLAAGGRRRRAARRREQPPGVADPRRHRARLHVLPYFKRIEDVPGGDPEYRGRSGPLSITPTARPHPLTLAFVQACRQAGHPRRRDFNCGELDETGTHDMTI